MLKLNKRVINLVLCGLWGELSFGFFSDFNSDYFPVLPVIDESQIILSSSTFNIESIQRQNSNYFRYEIGIDRDTDLPYNYVFIKPDGELFIGFYNTPTDIGYYFAYLVGVAKGDIKNDLLSSSAAINRLTHALEVLKNAPKKDGLLYWYDILSPEVKISPTNNFVSAVDNAFYAASLGLIIGAFVDDINPEAINLVSLARELLEEQRDGWKNLYDSKKKLLLGGYNFKKPEDIYYMDRIYNEGRLATIMAMVLGDVPQDVWDNLGEFYLEYTLSDGKKIKILAPWESAFQAWMPLVFIPEMEWSPQGFKLAHQRYLSVQRDWANRENMPGLYSECSDPFSKEEYKYITGIAIPGATEAGARGKPIRSDIGSVYAIGLAYTIDKRVALDFFEQLSKRFPQLITTIGWLDSVGRKGIEPNVSWTTSKAFVGKDQFVLLSALNTEKNHQYFIRFLEKFGKLDFIKSLYQGKKFSF
ncbi:MAG: hypothetical protein NC821_03385 [Candidatus Omnitrophica bacterium]|nr:hypothetical protein [Candidatus Omnitrophota bacterium]